MSPAADRPRLEGLGRVAGTDSVAGDGPPLLDAADPPPARDARGAPGRSGALLLAASYALIVIILFLDWVTPPGLVVAILLYVPFMLLALLDDARQLWIAGGVALVGRFADMLVGGAPHMPKVIWLPNRILTTVGVILSIAIARLLLRQRGWVQKARDAALRARDMNRLLVSLMAHDLRSPLVVANDALAYAERTAATELPVDTQLLADARIRLQRSLRTLESILAMARGEGSQSDDGPGGARARAATSVRGAILSEVASFAAEAAARGKPLAPQFDRACAEAHVLDVDALVLQQGLAILLDNAIRYANPGPVRVEVSASDREVVVRVGDSGPGLRAPRGSAGATLSHGAGLGLELCRALVGRAGGSMELERDGATGTVFALRLPLRRA